MIKSVLDYRLGKRLGKGAFSEVFLATKDDKKFAVKIMVPPPNVSSEELLESLRYEFWVLKDLDHPNIVHVYDFGRLQDGRIFLVEEFLEGLTLDKFCIENKFKVCEPVLLGVLKGLETIHKWKLIHGDIKPENILVVQDDSGNFVPKILDFGLARPVVTKHTGEESRLMGTPATMAPEIILKENPDERSDLYSFGVTAYKSLCGRNPFLGKSVQQTLQKHLKTIPDSLGLFRDDIPPVWDQAILKCLEKDVSKRMTSARGALSLLAENRFVLSPVSYVGHKDLLSQAKDLILTHEKSQKPFALCIHGVSGVGITRFAREVFFQTISENPEIRERVFLNPDALWFENPEGIAIIEADSASDIDHEKIELTMMSEKEVSEWLALIFGLSSVPGDFVEKIYELSSGYPKRVWDVLTVLFDKGKLADANGQVTKSTLKMIEWKNLFEKTEEFFGDFTYLLSRLKEKVVRRQALADDPLWEKIDSEIRNTKDTSLRLHRKAKTLLLKGAAHIDLGLLADAKRFLQTALEIFTDDEDFLIDALKTKNYLAYVALHEGDAAQAITLYEDVAKVMETTLSPRQRQEIHNLDLSTAYIRSGDWQKAYERAKVEKKLQKEVELSDRLILAYYNFASAAYHLEKNEESVKNYQEVIRLAKIMHNPAYLLRGFNGLGNVYNKEGKWSEAIQAYCEVMEVALALKDFFSATVAVQNRGKIYSREGDYDKALQDFETALQFLQKTQQKLPYEKWMECNSYLEMGRIAFAKHSYDVAKQHFQKAWYLVENNDDLKALRFDVLEARSRLWLAEKDWDRFKKELAQLNYYSETDEQKQILEELKNEYKSRKSETKSAREEQLERELQTILRINKELVGDMSLDELLKKILSYAIELAHAELGVILLADKRGRLRPKLSLNADLDEDLSEISQSVADKVLSTGRIIQSADAEHDENFNQYASVMSLNLKSILGVPIIFQGKVLGVLYLSHRYQTALFDEKMIQVVSTYADQVGLALKNHQLMDFYRKASEELKEDLEVTQESLERARAQLKTSTSIFDQEIDGKMFVTKSPEMMDIISQVERVANTSLTIVIHGESGTGKEVLAQYIHASSKRKSQPFIAINCGALPENLVESELFGHKKGAFTGADRDKMGLIEAANRGTLFLDEITDLPLETQVKLLRVLQEREVVRLGETRPRPVDVRVLAASLKNLKEAVQKKIFREDLYYRLAGMEVVIPALRARSMDIPLLAERFLKQFLKDQGKEKPAKIASSLLKMMMSYSWPGNIRELRNFIEVGVSLSDSKIMKKDNLPEYVVEKLYQQTTIETEDGDVQTMGWYHPRKTWREHELLIYASALHHYDFDATKVANSLDVGVATVYKWIREHKLKDMRDEWETQVLPYEDGLALDEIRMHVFQTAAKKHTGHPYHAAKELDVAPVTFYRWSQAG